MKTIQNRRSFIQKSGLLTSMALAGSKAYSGNAAKQYKAAIIGRTGAGDYGHGLDTIFNGLDNVTIAAVADADPAGLKRAAERSGAQRTYADFHEMLEKERPNLVSIGPRQPDCHREMALAAIEVGAHIYMEKPISEFPKDADDILSAAKKKGLKISLAHTKRYMDHFLLMKKLIGEGYLGDILEIRFRGKQDSRVGGEDLIVLGSHDMDMMRFFLGDPQWCFASVTANGRDITPADVRKGREPYTIAGDTIRADYQFNSNIQCRWSSVKGTGTWNQNYKHKDKTTTKWGFDIYGSKRLLSHLEGVGTFVLDCPFFVFGDPELKWTPIETIGSVSKPEFLSHPIRNLIHAIETDSTPQCSGEDARWAVEMVCATYLSQQCKGRVHSHWK